MDRDPNDTYGTTPAGGSGSGATPGYQNSGAAYGSGAGMSSGASSGANFGHAGGVPGTERDSGARDMSDKVHDARDTAEEKLHDAKRTASDKLHQVRDTASEKWGQAREKAGEWRVGLADKLDAGADKLQSRNAFDNPAYATPTADGASTQAKAQSKIADGMHSTADWLRNNDLDTMKSSIESQVRNNPGRSLLVAAVAGYLLGKAFRRR